MSVKRVGSWFLTTSGRTFAGGAATVAACSAFLVQFVPHTLLIDNYKDIVHLYRRGLTVPLPKVLNERFKKAVELAKIAEDEVNLYSAFPVYGFDIFSAGSAFSKFGCIVGLPITFAYTDTALIDRNTIKLYGDPITWELQEAKDFLNSLVLSEKAQLYAMAREIRMLQKPKVYIDSLCGALSVAAAYSLSRSINMKYNLYAKTLGVRLTMYTLTAAFAAVNFFFIKDASQIYYERKVDEELKAMDPVFSEGAFEYYDKTLKRNVALRKLMGKDGTKVYSILGNENYFLRQKSLPLVQRKAFFEPLQREDVENVM